MALSEALRKKYTPSIGIECHVQLKTKTKLFSAVGNDAREAAPNTLISHIDVGMPGALPVLNEGAIELACLAAFALNTEPQKHSYFERKHYFYPDLPMGYQISQLHGPIIVGGYVEIEVDGKKKKINLNRAQLEADAGKNTQEIVQETRGWDEAKQKTTTQRTKEEAQDYRYMPEPDVPPVELEDSFVKKMKSDLPILPKTYREELSKLGLTSEVVETLLIVTENSKLIFELMKETDIKNARRVALWFVNALENWTPEELPIDNEKAIPIDYFIKLSQMVEDNKISSSSGTAIFKKLLRTSQDPGVLAEDLNLLQVSDEGEIDKIVAEVLAENEKAAKDVKDGEMKAIGFLVGQVMKKSRGKANPQMAQDLIKKQLGI
jgi:Asp-tRNA(Asn)/Glu-tRNA(Gln) amidotransferase B subunit